MGDNAHISIQEAFAIDYLFKDAGIYNILKINKALSIAEGKFVYYQYSRKDTMFPSRSKVKQVPLLPIIKDLGSLSLNSSALTSLPWDLRARVAYVKMKLVLLMSCE